jgi:hypothetical protein
MLIFCLIIFFRSSSVWSDDLKNPEYHAIILNNNFDQSSLNNQDNKLIIDHLSEHKTIHLPTTLERDEIFAHAKILDELNKLDDLDKDRLYLYAKNNSLDSLFLKYPSLDRQKLSKLSSLIMGENK